MVLLTIIYTSDYMLYIRVPRTYSSYNWKFVPLDQHHPISPTYQPQPLEITILLSVSRHLDFLDSTYLSDNIWYLSFSV